MAQLRKDRGGAGIRRVDVEPRTGRGAAPCDLGNRVDGRHPGRPDRRDDGARILGAEEVGTHAELVVGRHLPQLQPKEPRGLLADRVRVLRDHEDVPVRIHRPRGDHRGQNAGGRGVLDVPAERIREADELAEPVDGQLLQLLQRGRRAPEDPDLVEAGDQELGEHARLRRGRREVGEEARALPVRETGHEDAVEVLQDRRERLRLLGRGAWKRGANLSGLDLREDREVPHSLEIRRDPVDGERAVLPERAHFPSFTISRQGRVFRICSFVSHARRACATPSSA